MIMTHRFILAWLEVLLCEMYLVDNQSCENKTVLCPLAIIGFMFLIKGFIV